MDQIANGGLLTTAQAATICEVCGQTICRWNDEAARRGEPKQATWLIGTARLLDYVEKYQGGLPARVKAESLLKKRWPIWSLHGNVGQHSGLLMHGDTRLIDTLETQAWRSLLDNV